MNTISFNIQSCKVEIQYDEIDRIMKLLELVVKLISKHEFETIIGFYLEDVECLNKKLDFIQNIDPNINRVIVEFNYEELIIINNTLNQFDLRQNDDLRQLFIEVRELITKMKNMGAV